MKSSAFLLTALLTSLPLSATQAIAAERVVIPVITISGTMTEKPTPEDLPFDFLNEPTQSLRSVLLKLEKAKDDDKVPAVVLKVKGTPGRAQSAEIARAIRALEAAGKPVHTHADVCMMGQYALMSAASEISMVPSGYMFITGFAGEQLFIRGLLDRLHVVPDFMTCGDYKGADEMFMRTEPSPEAAEMTEWLVDGMFDSLVASIAAHRSVEDSVVRDWIDTGVFIAEDAVEAGIIDVVEHTQELETRLRDKYGSDLKFDRRYGRKSRNTIDLSSPFGVLNFYAELLAPSTPRKSTTPGVGIVYLEGAIMPGSGGGNPLVADSAAFGDVIRKALDEAAEDDAIKAVVLRINSPGGSAVASEVILNASKRLASKKPLVISMGNVAASGGYYTACGTDTIFAEADTVTGSIGVVMGKLVTKDMFNSIGINFSPIRRGKNSGMLSTATKFSESERPVIRKYMDDVYELFKGHVTKARGERLTKPIDELAGGRVYTGRQAKELGLVDQLGGLQDAVAFAAEKAQLGDDFDVRTVPPTKNFMELLMGDLTGPKDDGKHLSLSSRSPAASLLNDSLLRVAVPLLKSLDPVRSEAVRMALMQLIVLQSEHVSLTSPIIIQ